MRDDRVLPGTRVLGAVIVPFLLVAFAALYFFPDDTRHWFAWNVQPTITPLIMGAGYIAGAYFFVRVARETRWHRIQVGFLPVTAFTLFMAIGTFAHLAVLDQDHCSRRRKCLSASSTMTRRPHTGMTGRVCRSWPVAARRRFPPS